MKTPRTPRSRRIIRLAAAAALFGGIAVPVGAGVAGAAPAEERILCHVDNCPDHVRTELAPRTGSMLLPRGSQGADESDSESRTPGTAGVVGPRTPAAEQRPDRTLPGMLGHSGGDDGTDTDDNTGSSTGDQGSADDDTPGDDDTDDGSADGEGTEDDDTDGDDDVELTVKAPTVLDEPDLGDSEPDTFVIDGPVLAIPDFTG